MKFKDIFQSYTNSPSPLREDKLFYKIGPEDRIKISAIREIILFEAKNDPKSIALEDVERIENDDIYIFRFINQHDGHLESALKTLRKSLRWRKENRINQLNLSTLFLPKELAQLRAFHSYVRDKNGTPTIYTRPVPIPPKKFKALTFDSIFYFGELVSKKVSQYGRRFGIINDCSNLVFHKSMVDPELLRESLRLRDLNYPDLYAYCAFYEFPVSLKWLFKILSPIIPKKTREKIIFIDKDTIDDFLGLDNVPDYMGGRCKMPYNLDPDSFPPIEKALSQRGYTLDDVEELRAYYSEEFKKFENELSKPDKKFIKMEELENYFD